MEEEMELTYQHSISGRNVLANILKDFAASSKSLPYLWNVLAPDFACDGTRE